MCTSNKDDRKLEHSDKQSRFKDLGELHKEWTEAGVSSSTVTLQEVPIQNFKVKKHIMVDVI